MANLDVLRHECGCVTMIRQKGHRSALVLRPCDINTPCAVQSDIDLRAQRLELRVVIEHG